MTGAAAQPDIGTELIVGLGIMGAFWALGIGWMLLNGGLRDKWGILWGRRRPQDALKPRWPEEED